MPFGCIFNCGAQEKVISFIVTGGGVQRIRGNWYTSEEAGQRVLVTAITQPNTPVVWANLVWAPVEALPVIGNPNQAEVVRAPAGGQVEVRATLDNSKTLNLNFVDFSNLECEDIEFIGQYLGHPTWKCYLNNPGVHVTASTNPNRRYQSEFTWAWNMGNPGSSNRRRIIPMPIGVLDYVITATLFTKPRSIGLRVCQVPVLQLSRLIFTGGHTVECDTLGNFDDEWELARPSPDPAVGLAALFPVPNAVLCYTRGTRVGLTPAFNTVTAPSMTEVISILAHADFNGTRLSWRWDNITITPGAPLPVIPQQDSDRSLPNQVFHYHNLTIHWETLAKDGVTRAAGQSVHELYTTLNAPAFPAPVYWTLLHHSCTRASGATTSRTVIANVFALFQTLNVTRIRDNGQLNYWNPNAAAKNIGDTQDLLAANNSGAPTGGTGHCGSWAEFLIDMWAVQGITTGEKVFIGHQTYINGGVNPFGFLVKNWVFNHPPASNAAALTHQLGVNVNPAPGIPGQGNPNPPEAFFNHFVALNTTTNRIYDPSYGVVFRNQNAWERAAVAGLLRDGVAIGLPDAGYDQTLNPGRLLQFRNEVTNLIMP